MGNINDNTDVRVEEAKKVYNNFDEYAKKRFEDLSNYQAEVSAYCANKKGHIPEKWVSKVLNFTLEVEQVSCDGINKEQLLAEDFEHIASYSPEDAHEAALNVLEEDSKPLY